MASTTELGEVAQAFFCAIADGVGLSAVNENFGPKLQPAGGKASNPLNGTLFRTASEASKAKEKDTFEEFESRWTTWIKNHRVSPGAIELKKIYDTYVKPNPTLSYGELTAWLKADPTWYRSSRNIAIALLKQIQTVSHPWQKKVIDPGWQDILYIRETGVMVDIKKLFEIANTMAEEIYLMRTETSGTLQNVMLPFANINKWSTADIYFVSTKGAKDIKDLLADAEEVGILFPVLNEFILELVKTGDLLPLSLKKSTSGEVHIFNVNFVEDARVQAINNVKYTPKMGTANTDSNDDEEESGSFAGRGFKPDFKNWAQYPVPDIRIRYGVDRDKMKKGSWPAGQSAKHYSRSFFLQIDASSGLRLQIRHDPKGTKGEIKVEVKDPASARGGSMNIGVVESIIRMSDPNAPKNMLGIAKLSEDLREKFTKAYLYSAGSGTGCFGLVKGPLTVAAGKILFEATKKGSKSSVPFTGQFKSGLGKQTGKRKLEIKSITDKSYQILQRDTEFAELSAHHVTDPLFKEFNDYIRSLEGTEEGRKKLTNMVRLMYMFATAQSRDSAPYVLAK